MFSRQDGFDATLFINFDAPRVYDTSLEEFKKQKQAEKEEKRRKKEERKIRREKKIQQLFETEKIKPGKGIPIKK